MAKMVPYLTPRQRWSAVVAFVLLFGATLLALRDLTTVDDPPPEFVALGVIFLGAAAHSWWSDRNCPLVAREQLLRRYAAELLDMPRWQPTLIYGAAYTAPALLANAIRYQGDAYALWLTLVVLVPLGYLVGLVVTYFERRRATKLLSRNVH